MKTIILIALSCLFYHAGMAQSTTLFLADKDNTLYESSSGARSNGAGDWLFSGRTGQVSNTIRRALIHFDISTLPANAVIDSVKLNVTFMAPQGNGSQLITVHRVTNSWGEGTDHAGGNEGGGAPATAGSATWIHRVATGTLWSSAGGDFNSSSSGFKTIGASAGVYTFGPSAGLLSDVQAWQANATVNHGWLLLGNEGTTNTAKRFCSRENTSIPPCGPALTVHWHTAPLSLVYFNAEQIDNDAKLSWIYNNPSALYEIEVQHAGEDVNFKTFRKLEGSSLKPENALHYYNLGPGSHYFRLVFILKDGQKEFSAIKALEVKERGLKVYPNPVQSTINISIGNSEISLLKDVRIYSLEGRLVRSFGSNKILDIADLENGFYNLVVEYNNRLVHKRIIKN